MNRPDEIVFMYHGVVKDDAEIPPLREAGAELYDVSLRDFYGQMEFLKRHYYPVIAYGKEINGNALVSSELPKIVITFDDGEMNNYEEAWPVLKMCKFPAYFFVTVNRVGKLGYMGWKELSELSQAGMIIGSHGMNHEILTRLNPVQLKRELLDSRLALEKKLQIRIKDFSVPRGFYNAEVVKVAGDSGYEHVFVSEEKPPFPACVGRIAVQSYWSSRRFEMALQGQKPIDEQVVHFFKNTVKQLLGGQGYDRLRSALLKLKP